MTGQTLAAVTELLKEKIDDSLTVGTANDQRYYLAIEKKQQALASTYDWSQLQSYWECTVNSRYPTIPTVDYNAGTQQIDFNRRPELYTLYSQRYQPVVYGIGVAEWNLFNPDLGFVQDPIQRWQVKADSSTLFEVWPVPATFPQYLRFVGWRNLNTLRSAESFSTSLTLDLDDRLVAYAVAWDMQVDKLAPSAVNIQREWTTLLQTIRGNDKSRPDPLHMGNSTSPWNNPRERLVGGRVIVTM